MASFFRLQINVTWSKLMEDESGDKDNLVLPRNVDNPAHQNIIITQELNHNSPRSTKCNRVHSP